ncbi:MAG: glycoside hydrolase family 13 protein [Eubacteriales bacterium]|nr:glycoside hydrolase family 13 protein [Eubacteriales bacterium]MDD3881209.1 glycoside hydrolase family 13 protein [Eubacteriales bacterium]MDD4511591.1 glycoside hydrolase family 13 protein [Eubacteriales bacterium]
MYHNTRSEEYRLPTGALTAGERVRLRFAAPEDAERVYLRAWDGAERLLPMAKIENDMYEVTARAPDAPGLWWYFFKVETPHGTRYYGNNERRAGGEGKEYDFEPPSFQVTVRFAAFEPPKWLRNGIMYQIFPDRFRKAPTKAVCARSDIILHENWNEQPLTDVNNETGDNMARDFFGGTLTGIKEKLGYLEALGVTVLYINPVFSAHSNHRYDTSDYSVIDSLLGTNEEFAEMCAEAEKHGIRVILDGVFSHTGADSVYFNKDGRFGAGGAYNDKNSPYFNWYTFKNFPDEYECWWNFPTLPNVSELYPSYLDYIVEGGDSIIKEWLRRGASGWRLDVADELPMPFLRALRHAVKETNADAAIIGEVWEDASHKTAYGELRSYCVGDTLDTVMNYPLYEALSAFLLLKITAGETAERINIMRENYPAGFFYSLMNLTGSHDRARILNVLAGKDGENVPREKRGEMKLTKEERATAVSRYMMYLRFIMCFPGMPSVYYGDEAGMEGAADPCCRAPYPWGAEDERILGFAKQEIRRRKSSDVLRNGAMSVSALSDDVLMLKREISGGQNAFGESAQNGLAVLYLNRSDKPQRVPADFSLALPDMPAVDGDVSISLAGDTWMLWLKPLSAVLFTSGD